MFSYHIIDAEKMMQNREIEHRRWLPEAVRIVRRVVRFTCLAHFIKSILSHKNKNDNICYNIVIFILQLITLNFTAYGFG